MDRTVERQQALAVLLLSLCYLFSLIDRLVINLLVDPIRADLGLSDVQIALIQGPVFAVLYAIAGVPFGLLADRRSRRNLAAAAIGFWSLFSMATGAAINFATIALARIGVGVGEAALTPAAYSLLADLLPANRLGRAIAVYTAAGALGSGAALLLGGAIHGAIEAIDPPVAPWRLTLLLVSAPGLLLALLVLRFVREPSRGGEGTAADRGSVLRLLGANPRFYGSLFLAYAALGTLLFGFLAWMPSVFIRHYAMSPAQAGGGFGLAMLVGGAIGPLCAGWLADRWRETRGLQAPLLVMAIGFVGAGLVAATLPFIGSVALMLVAGGLLGGIGTGLLGMPALAIQLSTPSTMRGTISAINLMIGNIIGMSAGPLLVVLAGGGDPVKGLALVAVGAALCGAGFCRIGLTACAPVRGNNI